MPNNVQIDARATREELRAIAERAGEIALGFFEPGGQTSAGVDWKGDGSPVTEADLAVNAFLEGALRDLWPGAAWLSEESVDDARRLAASHVVIVDPIDGTRGFARGDRHWAVAIALVHEGRPVSSIVHAPALGETYTALAGEGAALNGAPIRVHEEAALRDSMHITCPKGLAEALTAAGIALDFRPKIASLALRIAKVASGVYDAGFATSNSHDWDLAAADLVLEEAGGLLADLEGRPLRYNKVDPSHGVLTATPRRLQPSFRAALDRTTYGRPLART